MSFSLLRNVRSLFRVSPFHDDSPFNESRRFDPEIVEGGGGGGGAGAEGSPIGMLLGLTYALGGGAATTSELRQDGGLEQREDSGFELRDGPPVDPVYNVLLETGDILLLEAGDKLLLE